MGGACSTYGGEERAFRVLVRKPEEGRPLVRHRNRWKDNIEWIFEKWYGGAWTGSIWLRIGTGGGLL
jgi:hypothetical protein